MSTSLVVLTWNEIDGVRAVLPRIPVSAADEIVVVDGGSTDGTREFCEELGLRVVSQDRRGRGEAFRVGMRATSGDFVVFFSPDGNEDPADIPRLFAALADGADIAIASRFLAESRNEEDGAAVPLRKWVNMAFTRLANLIWNRSGPFVTDTINGYRGVRRDVFADLQLESMGFTIEFEMCIRAMKRRRRIIEIPTSEGERIGGKTKAPSFRTGCRFVHLFFSEIFSR